MGSGDKEKEREYEVSAVMAAIKTYRYLIFEHDSHDLGGRVVAV